MTEKVRVKKRKLDTSSGEMKIASKRKEKLGELTWNGGKEEVIEFLHVSRHFMS